MNDAVLPQNSTRPPAGTALTRTGWVITALAGAIFILGGTLKLRGGPDLAQGMEEMGLPLTMARPLGLLELACAAVYLVPQTAVLGAVLLTGYMGGAICTHWRVGDPFIFQFIIGVFVWLGIFCREPRLWPLLPIRRR